MFRNTPVWQSRTPIRRNPYVKRRGIGDCLFTLFGLFLIALSLLINVGIVAALAALIYFLFTGEFLFG